ncbi:glycoside hydrolase family 2 TIM barrel-domain containing protein [Coraliomargarita parva]|uniref:glycoside hydrolase family 2 TIM barrel-domain containing protein n=1 Tax=Coraliomargarita parva TaxID=3014050 RepID=UPI0022B5A722|nr:glycoside hydrolase family 2 TIM barrel-domain containing protein [Coraliomargarita parva]
MTPVSLSPKPSCHTPLVQWSTVLSEAPDPIALDNAAAWKSVNVPHNWDDYHGYHEVCHGNLHGIAWYKTHFQYNKCAQERLYAFFEGVGSYATVYINKQEAGYHAGGRTTFTVDLTDHLVEGVNELLVKADHREMIDDLPFVCGGCWGAPNTEGSQPMGIFRPAWLESTGPVRIEPFGVHVQTPKASELVAEILTVNTLSNPTQLSGDAIIRQSVLDSNKLEVAKSEKTVQLTGQIEETVSSSFPVLENPQLWSPENPHLYTMHTEVLVNGNVSHITDTTFGIRWIEWPHIEAPDADYLGVSVDRRGTPISWGVEPLTLENNGLTEIAVPAKDGAICLAPMGVSIQQTADTTNTAANLVVDLTLQAALESDEPVQILCEIQNEMGTIFFHQYRKEMHVTAPQSNLRWQVPTIIHPHMWSKKDPYLHKLVVEIRTQSGELSERSVTLFGMRDQPWDTSTPLNLTRPVYEALPEKAAETQSDRERVFKVNGQPLFMRGTCEYETMLGCDHAFTEEQIAADVTMMKAAGFNAFRDAHHPHNLRYYDHWDQAGIVCWTQMGSCVWFDNDRFRENYKQLVREWVKERRNHPCIIMWGIQNESPLPKEFAEEIRDIIIELDPTCPQWRITTTCNGGKGSDWNVPQDWSGTYGRNCHDYDLQAIQMVGEYGAWRTFGVHTETEYNGDENDRSESWACAAMEIKLRLGDEARNDAIGHFHWIFNTFPNPGRAPDNCEGPDNSKIGSVNNKGLVTAWHQPSDLYYMFRSHYTLGQASDPMVYIVSHTWPNRWINPQPRKVRVYSNCEEVELFNGVERVSYGKKTHPGFGYHYIWENVLPETNILHAIGYQNGQKVTEDIIRLDHLPEDESVTKWIGETKDVSAEGTVLYRVNCGSDQAYIDDCGATWSPDTAWTDSSDFGWISWGNRFDNVEDDLASKGFTMTPVRGTTLQQLYRTYRYGRHCLKYHFKTGPGKFRIRCHYAEPWFGVGGFKDAEQLRLFDVAINDTIVDAKLDIHKASGGHHRALVREYDIEITSATLTLHFPTIHVNQAIIFGIECIKL